MTAIQIFAFLALPAAIAAVGWIVAFIVAPTSRATEPDTSYKERGRHA